MFCTLECSAKCRGCSVNRLISGNLMSLVQSIWFIANHPINRNQKLASIARFARWQIGSRLVPGKVVYEWINGCKFIVGRGETGLTGNIYTGLHEFPDMGFLLHVLRPEDIFVDIGANVGSYTLLASAAVGARSFAYEPIPGTFNKLLDNVRLNRIEHRVQAFNIGLAQQDGTILFTSDLNTVNHAVAQGEPSAGSIEVQVRTLDHALAGQGAHIIKIDVEGYETPVLEGARETIHNPALHAVIMELNGSGNRYGFDESRLLATLLAAGFKTFSYNPLTRQLKSLEGKNLHEGNTLFIRDEAWVQARLAAAPAFDVLGVRV